MIRVQQTTNQDPLEFEVEITEPSSATRHHVTMSRALYDRLTGGSALPDHCVEAAFRFLLDREPKEAILSRFDVGVISRYFPEFEAKLPDYLPGSSSGDTS